MSVLVSGYRATVECHKMNEERIKKVGGTGWARMHARSGRVGGRDWSVVRTFTDVGRRNSIITDKLFSFHGNKTCS
jgi:hypothetical protein